MKFGKRPACGLKSLKNWVALCVLIVVVLLLCHDPLLIIWWPQKPAEKTQSEGLPLDMATDSIDDMFDGCRSEAASMIDLFGVFEWHFNRNFSFAWASAERDAKKPAYKFLKEDHAIVMYMYTKLKHIQEDFNKAVKTGKHKYSTYGFKYHYFYFYLTDAIQVLRQNQTSCRTTYHRTWRQFNRNVVHTNMRFGAFTLAASTKPAFDFNGNVSCFEIYTCFGADVTYYSATNQMGQVLIPPYEVFKITDVLTNDPWCSVVYKLESTKIPARDLNCKLHQYQIKKYFGDVPTHWHKNDVGMRMLVYVLLMVIVALVLVIRGKMCFVAAVTGALLVLIFIAMIVRISQ
ncbi:ecto-ADP-ribosyltransferase 4-like [Seriola dumerili]|uniref:ecto-ADP-ribosyltransferase 4-like n=1 Tax=Seriola dumerili TaxID=41447 RepID=UPI000BBEC9AF|nr:ecto-ADP-ribosyltransferase 4-like [Seriola dumerili]